MNVAYVEGCRFLIFNWEQLVAEVLYCMASYY